MAVGRPARRGVRFGRVAQVFEAIAVLVADALAPAAWLGPWRLLAIDGFDWDVLDTAPNAAEFGYAGSGANASAFPKARVVTISECASHAVVAAGIDGMSSGEQTLARELYRNSPGLTGVSALMKERRAAKEK